ncbi:hypothetical protein L1887_09425 [Cichorium endivia]|nr:hypothetical protein L1887_09425 [Cichorium endivia]
MLSCTMLFFAISSLYLNVLFGVVVLLRREVETVARSLITCFNRRSKKRREGELNSIVDQFLGFLRKKVG